jgi:hypothetical protein
MNMEGGHHYFTPQELDMTGQYSFFFTSDDEEESDEMMMSGFPPFYSPKPSPKTDDDRYVSPKGNFFASSFDWEVEVNDGDALKKNDIMSPLLPSSGDNNNALCSSHGASSFSEASIQQPPLKRRDSYASLYSATPSPDFAASQQSPYNAAANNNNGGSLFPPQGTAPLMARDPYAETASLYAELFQAQADYAVMQQQFSASCVQADKASSNAEAVDLFSASVAPSPPSTNTACGPSSLGLCYDQFCYDQPLQLDQVPSQMMMQGVPQFGYQQQQQLKRDDAPQNFDPNQLYCGTITSGVVEEESNNSIGQTKTNILPDHPTRLSIPSDEQFLDPVHNFLRSACIEVFVSGSEYNTGGRGRGSKPHEIGQVGLRCVHCKHIQRSKRANQAVSYPSKTANIFESVRNYQRTHFEACAYIPGEIKQKYKELASQTCRKIHLKYIKVYFAEAACEIGMVQTPNGLFFGAPPNTSGKPSKKLLAIMKMAENPDSSEHVEMRDLIFPKVDERLENSKFSHIASVNTRQVIDNCRREKAVFVYPSDFPTLSDFRFVLYHQFVACRPPITALSRRKTKPEKWDTLSGLCCKHCAKVDRHHKGMYFPLDLESLHDSSFSQNLTWHIMTCQHTPLETKEALEELQRLAAEHGVLTKRGTKKDFMKKLWDRMANYYPTPR